MGDTAVGSLQIIVLLLLTSVALRMLSHQFTSLSRPMSYSMGYHWACSCRLLPAQLQAQEMNVEAWTSQILSRRSMPLQMPPKMLARAHHLADHPHHAECGSFGLGKLKLSASFVMRICKCMGYNRLDGCCSQDCTSPVSDLQSSSALTRMCTALQFEHLSANVSSSQPG